MRACDSSRGLETQHKLPVRMAPPPYTSPPTAVLPILPSCCCFTKRVSSQLTQTLFLCMPSQIKPLPCDSTARVRTIATRCLGDQHGRFDSASPGRAVPTKYGRVAQKCFGLSLDTFHFGSRSVFQINLFRPPDFGHNHLVGSKLKTIPPKFSQGR